MVKIITGFNEDQKYSIPIEEAHKAYYLFFHPEERGMFSGGLALIGKNIQTIQPDWHGTMGWNQGHKLDSDDWNEINSTVKEKMEYVMEKAKQVSIDMVRNPELMGKSLLEIIDERSNKKLLS